MTRTTAITAIVLLVFSAFSSSVFAALETVAFHGKIKEVLIYPSDKTTPDNKNGYSELVFWTVQDMTTKPACAVQSNRFVIESHNPSFPYMFTTLMSALKTQETVLINYFTGNCESSGNHQAPLVRAIQVYQ